ncbi:hypothetical protein [Arthrobacter sp. ES1]|uniref:hypothetical protein n=1 Tax=Arthrobacter sp. ES1 TaxID=1897056 RepID=UPI001CFF7705|nr:hypothetical protein [Arthrobacter sp. ES1]MCB5280304.1 hypothetical protein [Arthrobacter sp. ES1]
MTTAEHPSPAQMQLLKEMDELHLPPEAVLDQLHTYAAVQAHYAAIQAHLGVPDFNVPDRIFPDMTDAVTVSGGLNSLWSTVRAGVHALGAAMAANPVAVSPQMARSLQAAENIWRNIEREFGMLTSMEVAERLGSRKPNRSMASALRNEGSIVGIMRGNSYRFPGFQFDTDKAAVVPVMPKLIALARENERSDEGLVYWLTSPSSLFHEQDRPVDHLHEEDRVLAAARDQFEGTW